MCPDISQNTERIFGATAKSGNRIPDLLTHIDKVFGEIKGVKNLSLSGQLKDFINYAGENGYSFRLYLRPDTTLTKPLIQQLKRIGSQVFDVADGQAVRRVI